MIFKGKGNKELPVVILLHGGGLSDYSLDKAADLLIDKYYVVSVIIDGHGEDASTEFISIENSANKLIEYINNEFNGEIFAICGLSIGAQIVCEVISKESAITKNAVIESVLVIPMKMVTTLTVPSYHLMYGLIKRRWFSRMQAKTLCIKDDLFEQYYNDSIKMTKKTLINITKSNGDYSLKPSIADTKAKVLVIVGENEISIMKKSAKLINETINGSELLIAKNLKHGELSLNNTEEYVKKIKDFFKSGMM